jgi:hypothetical protein
VGQTLTVAKINQFEILNVTGKAFPLPEGATPTTDRFMLARAKN